jgi:hypothetical protein
MDGPFRCCSLAAVAMTRIGGMAEAGVVMMATVVPTLSWRLRSCLVAK